MVRFALVSKPVSVVTLKVILCRPRYFELSFAVVRLTIFHRATLGLVAGVRDLEFLEARDIEQVDLGIDAGHAGEALRTS